MTHTYHGDNWVPSRYEGEAAPRPASGYHEGDLVTHVVWGRKGTVMSVRQLDRPAKDGSRWMLRVRWDEGGVGTDGDTQFIKRRKPPTQAEGVALTEREELLAVAESLFSK